MPETLTERRTRLHAPEPWTLAGRAFVWGERTYVMGIVNVTPDSFSDGGRVAPEDAVAHGLSLLDQGADVLDVGGESTRPGSLPVSADEELRRILPVIRALAERGAVVSVDTNKPEVAEAAVAAGAVLINDITGLRHGAMLDVAARLGVPVVAMHMQGTPQTMQDDPRYEDVVAEVRAFLLEAALRARARGVKVMIDPGPGFGKTVEHNLTLLRHLDQLHVEGCPTLLATSRKGFIGKVLDLPVGERLEGTLATLALGVARGADMVRVHDVKAAVRTVRMADAIVRGRP